MFIWGQNVKHQIIIFALNFKMNIPVIGFQMYTPHP